MKILKLFITISLILVLAGCGLDRVQREVPPQIITKWKTYDCGVPPARDHINFTVPRFVVTSEGHWQLTAEQYAILGEAMQDIKKASGQLVELVRFYEKCIEKANEPTTEAP